ncbi:MAG: sigma-70 family RNA polymerase sigma factor [Bryobacteraceae bacterium]
MPERPGPLSTMDEQELVRLAQARDEAAFQELIRRSASTSMRLALSIVKNRQEAEDQVQTSFFKAWQAIGRFKAEAKFSTWLRTIVANQSLMHLRTARRTPEQSIEDGRDNGFVFEPADSRPNHEAELGRSEVARQLHSELRRMPPLLRDVLELRHVQELSIEEVAARLGISEAAVKSRLTRARQMLRDRMERHGTQLSSLLA